MMVLTWLLMATACATSPYDRAWVSAELGSLAAPLGPGVDTPASLPPGVEDAEPLDERTAVAVALWNSAALQADMAQLGVSRADLAEAGALPNPTFSLLLPVGPRTIESSLLLPLFSLWQRPARVAAAKAQVEQVARGLVQNGLDVARDVRVAHADWVLAEGRRVALEELSALWSRTLELAQARFEAGDASRTEMDALRAETLLAEDTARRSRTDVLLARERLRLLMGVVQSPLFAAARPRGAPLEAKAPRPLPDLIQLAQAARPDVLAAELGIQMAGGRLGWEKSRIVNLLARLDVKPSTSAKGSPQALWVPGAQLELPLFNWNPGGVGRAEAELMRASARYVLLRQQVANEVLVARERVLQSAASLQAFEANILPAFTSASEGVRKSFDAGDAPYVLVLDALRRLADARLRTLELEADLRRALAQLDRGLGKQGVAHE
ncbi:MULTISPECIES: TolC family protein [Corallococcus]|uniref:TolC family protein n=1 Tax=Corallococcus TaxID=83461 RepID=UPI0013780B8E|nr:MULTISPECIES: TolC family protein [Corallococcus]NBD08222.1 TolC family protein [Corallococcus silvisoli]